MVFLWDSAEVVAQVVNGSEMLLHAFYLRYRYHKIKGRSAFKSGWLIIAAVSIGRMKNRLE